MNLAEFKYYFDNFYIQNTIVFDNKTGKIVSDADTILKVKIVYLIYNDAKKNYTLDCQKIQVGNARLFTEYVKDSIADFGYDKVNDAYKYSDIVNAFLRSNGHCEFITESYPVNNQIYEFIFGQSQDNFFAYLKSKFRERGLDISDISPSFLNHTLPSGERKGKIVVDYKVRINRITNEESKTSDEKAKKDDIHSQNSSKESGISKDEISSTVQNENNISSSNMNMTSESDMPLPKMTSDTGINLFSGPNKDELLKMYEEYQKKGYSIGALLMEIELKIGKIPPKDWELLIEMQSQVLQWLDYDEEDEYVINKEESPKLQYNIEDIEKELDKAYKSGDEMQINFWLMHYGQAQKELEGNIPQETTMQESRSNAVNFSPTNIIQMMSDKPLMVTEEQWNEMDDAQKRDFIIIKMREALILNRPEEYQEWSKLAQEYSNFDLAQTGR